MFFRKLLYEGFADLRKIVRVIKMHDINTLYGQLVHLAILSTRRISQRSFAALRVTLSLRQSFVTRFYYRFTLLFGEARKIPALVE